MRELTTHQTNLVNDELKIMVAEPPGHGGASHHYQITGFDTLKQPAPMVSPCSTHLPIVFQNGPVGEVGVNGITHEALLAILIDRMEGFQGGPYANEHNATALHHLRAALEALGARTKERVARGVEGTHKV